MPRPGPVGSSLQAGVRGELHLKHLLLGCVCVHVRAYNRLSHCNRYREKHVYTSKFSSDLLLAARKVRNRARGTGPVQARRVGHSGMVAVAVHCALRVAVHWRRGAPRRRRSICMCVRSHD